MTLIGCVEGSSVAPVLAVRATQDPEGPFLLFRGRALTCGEVDSRAEALAASLHNLGIEVGDRVALVLPACLEFVISMFTAAKIGATIVPLILDSPLPSFSIGSAILKRRVRSRSRNTTASRRDVQVVRRRGCFLTGDLVIVDEEEFVPLVGRRKEVIMRFGFNVYPREVEDRLQAHPAVREAAVVGISDLVLGEAICSCVVSVEGAIVTGQEIKNWCRVTLADYKITDLVRFLDRFQLTGTGKVRRVELARTMQAEQQSRRA